MHEFFKVQNIQCQPKYRMQSFMPLKCLSVRKSLIKPDVKSSEFLNIFYPSGSSIIKFPDGLKTFISTWNYPRIMKTSPNVGDSASCVCIVDLASPKSYVTAVYCWLHSLAHLYVVTKVYSVTVGWFMFFMYKTFCSGKWSGDICMVLYPTHKGVLLTLTAWHIVHARSACWHNQTYAFEVSVYSAPGVSVFLTTYVLLPILLV